MSPAIRISTQGQVATVVLNRPEVRNAFNDEVIAELTQAFVQQGNQADVRAIVLMAEGPAFCAGADLNWMRRMADYTRDENLAAAAVTLPADVLAQINVLMAPGTARGATLM